MLRIELIENGCWRRHLHRICTCRRCPSISQELLKKRLLFAILSKQQLVSGFRNEGGTNHDNGIAARLHSADDTAFDFHDRRTDFAFFRQRFEIALSLFQHASFPPPRSTQDIHEALCPAKRLA